MIPSCVIALGIAGGTAATAVAVSVAVDVAIVGGASLLVQLLLLFRLPLFCFFSYRFLLFYVRCL